MRRGLTRDQALAAGGWEQADGVYYVDCGAPYRVGTMHRVEWWHAAWLMIPALRVPGGRVAHTLDPDSHRALCGRALYRAVVAADDLRRCPACAERASR